LNLALFASLPERGLLTARGMARLLLIPGQLLAAGLAVRIDPQSLGGWLDHPVADAWLTAWTEVPQIPMAAFAGTFSLLAVRSIRRRSPIEAGFFWAAVAAFGALHGFQRGWNPTSALATGGAVLIGALVQTAYRMAYHDELTGLPGRRAMNEALLRVGSRYAVAMVDGLDAATTDAVKTHAPPRHWAAAEVPVVYDRGSGKLCFFEKTPMWGAAYYRGFRKEIAKFLA
jgi:hypothetical protein